MKYTFLFAGLLFACGVGAQPMTEPLNTRPALLSALCPFFRNAFSFSGNPATLGGGGKLMLAVAGERRFALAELGSYGLAARLPLAGNGIGIRVGQGGAAGWSATSVAGAYGMQLGTLAALGLGFVHTRSGTPALRSGSNAVQAGATIRLRPQALFGLSATEPLPRTGTKEAAGGEARYTMALGWEEPGQWMLGLELFQAGDRRPALSAGFQLLAGKVLRFGAGIDTSLSSMYVAAAVPLAGMLLQISVMVHRQLGPTPGLLLSYPAQ
ncbi:hypothetical protein EPD60_13465 [Flaviaesturariibacter flavus]|uniref:Type IX secretion system membrane protein PorP/SprF n=1 Tax=Flaviaesturariibacter flavus TaxID=2502780 RepID=A0A4R1B5V7_9BACT|nr:hypothetical protein [Flaviaesturariibacter flavus]TCJ13391.1 hypothetical protein EPD60_13465 [Flaviaesturariibacter flavus]